MGIGSDGREGLVRSFWLTSSRKPVAVRPKTRAGRRGRQTCAAASIALATLEVTAHVEGAHAAVSAEDGEQRQRMALAPV